ncbi:MAG: cohesin domain-containing protein [Bacteroidetes bacterium]|nr:cohesin domain-containing protein [Bacteroidota bacterium]
MKKPGVLLSCFFILITLTLRSQNAPVTTVTSILNPPADSHVTVPVTVTGFTDIGSISLTLNYDPAVMSFTGFSANASLPGFVANELSSGKIVMMWYALYGVTLTDNPSTLVNLIFTYPTSTTTLHWYPVTIYCEYSKFDLGAYNVLNDDPSSLYYIDGTITFNHVDPGSIASDQTICYGTAATVFTSVAATGTGTITYQWQNSTTDGLSGFNNIPGVTNETYSAGTLTTTTWYRRIASSTVNITVVSASSNAVKITVHARHTISGTLKYNNPDYSIMNKVYIALMSGSDTISTCRTADGTGGYQFTGICDGNYKILIVHNYRLSGSINSTDASQVNYWSSNQLPIEHVKFLAGDVYYNGSGSPNTSNPFINASDAMQVQRHYVFNLPPSSFDRDPWCYWKAGQTIANDFDPNRLLEIDANLNGADLTINLLAQVTGDFNCSYIPDGKKEEASATLHLTYGETIRMDAGKEFEMPIRVVKASKVGAVSMILNFPLDLIEVKAVYMKDNPGQLDWALNGSELRVGWNSLYPLDLPAFDSIVILKLKTTDKFRDDKTIRFSLAPDQLNELAGEDYKVIPDALLSIDEISTTAIGIQEQPGLDKMTLKNQPNPFSNYTMIEYTLPFDGKVILEVRNLVGQTVKTLVNEMQTSGTHSLRFDSGSLVSGVYTATIRLNSNNNSAIRTIKLFNNR